MSNLPNRNIDLMPEPAPVMYSEVEMEHLFARREARRDIDRLTNDVVIIHRKLLEGDIKQTAASAELRQMVVELPNQLAIQIARCREEIRKEIQDNYPTKIENLEMRTHIEAKITSADATLEKQIAAVDRKLSEEIKTGHALLSDQIKTSHTELKNDLKVQWLKVSIPVAVVISVAGALTWIITTGLKLINQAGV